jgi:glucokinase
MVQALLADIGGSNTRFAVCEPGGRPERVMVVDNESVSGPEAAIRRYLGEAAVSPQIAVLAVAGLVDGDEIRLTNRDWHFNLAQVGERFGFARAHAINDFEAVAHALAVLQPDELRALGPVAAVCHGPRAVFGPGTGLGVAALLPHGKDWIAMASEGGHVSFGPAAPDERKVFQRLAQSLPAISAETVISGPGLERLYRAINPQSTPLVAKTIVAQAVAGDDDAVAAVDLFVRLLGRFAGDLALMLKATGGVYVAGGVCLKLGALLDEAIFRAAFEAHPPYRDLLATIPTWLIVCAEPGLIGCAAVAARLARS